MTTVRWNIPGFRTSVQAKLLKTLAGSHVRCIRQVNGRLMNSDGWQSGATNAALELRALQPQMLVCPSVSGAGARPRTLACASVGMRRREASRPPRIFEQARSASLGSLRPVGPDAHARHERPLGTRFARLGRFPMGRAHPQGAIISRDTFYHFTCLECHLSRAERS